ncbi:MAG: HNH endonuclease signature motif containing protein, partial [Actinomadura sp.]
GWGPVIADIARQIADQRAAEGSDGAGGVVWRYSITDPLTGGLRYHGTTRPPRPERRARDPRRFPTKQQREFVIARDRTCRGPGCRVPARRAEIDHRIPHTNGGPTEVWNLDAKCAACHDLKDGGWTTSRNAFEDTTWESLLGHRYQVPATPITPPRELSVVEAHLLKTLRKRM